MKKLLFILAASVAAIAGAVDKTTVVFTNQTVNVDISQEALQACKDQVDEARMIVASVDEKVVAAQQYAEDAQNAKEDVEIAVEDAIDDINSAAASANSAAQRAEEATIAANNAATTAVQEVNTAKTSAVSAVNSAKTTSLADMQTFADNFEQQIKDGHVDYNISVADVPYTYVDQDGVEWPEIVIHPSGEIRGVVELKNANDGGNGVLYRINVILYLMNEGSTSAARYSFTCEPAYCSSHAFYGLEIHYVPIDITTLIGSGLKYKYVINDVFWANGRFYVVYSAYNKSTGSFAYSIELYTDITGGEGVTTAYPKAWNVDYGKTFTHYNTKGTADYYYSYYRPTSSSAYVYEYGGVYTKTIRGNSASVFIPKDANACHEKTIHWMRTGDVPSLYRPIHH